MEPDFWVAFELGWNIGNVKVMSKSRDQGTYTGFFKYCLNWRRIVGCEQWSVGSDFWVALETAVIHS